MLLQAVDVRFAYDRDPSTPVRSTPGRRSAPAFVVDGVSIEVEPRMRLGILGPNGSGKTTLLRLLSGALTPDSGSIRIDGADLSTVGRRALARRLAVVPQETDLAFDYTALEIALMGRFPHLGAFEIESPADLAIAMSALEATGTAEFADRTFSTLSGGEKQRVSIASALAQLEARQPHAGGPAPGPDPLLLLDEPTASLDLHYQIEVGALVRRLNESRGIAVVLSTHDLLFARAVCTHVVLLADGRILAKGPIADVLTPALVAGLYRVPPETVAPLLQ